MKTKVEAKLTSLLNRFIGQKLVDVQLKEEKVNGRDILLMEMTFNKEDHQIMVLALDKDLTEGNYKGIVEKILK